jgi:hypothetical protein
MIRMNAITKFLDEYLTRTGRPSIDPVEANALLAKAGILRDSKDRPGKPLRNLLRKGQFPHAFQSGGKGSGWTIPHSSKQTISSSNYLTSIQSTKKAYQAKSKSKVSVAVDNSELKTQLEKARLKYKPDKVKYLLIAEAPPDSIERFFYYDNVDEKDYLFLGVTQSLYPDLKDKFLASRRSSVIKNEILLKLKSEGFYLLDLSEVPLSLLTVSLSSQLPTLIDKVKKVADKQTRIILIKVNVYDIVFHSLQEEFENVVDIRIPFPLYDGVKLFPIKFDEALKSVGYR